MRAWDAQRVAAAAGASLLRGPAAGERGPVYAAVDSRSAGPGDLFVGLRGDRVDGGRFAAAALTAGAWGVLVEPAHASAAVAATGAGAVLAADNPLTALWRLATAWRRDLGATVIGVTGSTGKTSTKDLLGAVLSPARRTVTSRANFNTEIGVPLQILAAPQGTEVLVLEMAMRGAGQIALLARIAEPDVGVIVSIGPVHLEQLGSLEAIASAKAELVAALAPSATAVLPAGERLLEPHLRTDVKTLTFGPDGDVRLVAQHGESVEIDAQGEHLTLTVNFDEAHLRHDLLAAVAAAIAIGVRPAGKIELVRAPGRGLHRLLPRGVTLIDDAYNANPMSMRAALDALAVTPAQGRRVAVLGDMLELGPEAGRYHREIGAYANGIADLLVSVGPLAAAMAVTFRGEHQLVADAATAAALLDEILSPGDVVLVKGSNGVGLKLICEKLLA
ncbi:MAG: UDP-N-acetylmuramoyl-tripeptide--D-alanyl-D-alanine ligase [Actinomycetota bacterium]|nr:UDP-N-acetylmuramoyl-tripeptide--D-alanyl-D-alanine ligase [Actinomycetota bacterium]